MGRCGQVKTLSMLPILCARYPAYLHDFNPDLGVVFLVFLAILPRIFGFKSHHQVAQSDDMDQNVGYQSTRQRIAICHICSTKPPRAIAVSYAADGRYEATNMFQWMDHPGNSSAGKLNWCFTSKHGAFSQKLHKLCHNSEITIFDVLNRSESQFPQCFWGSQFPPDRY